MCVEVEVAALKEILDILISLKKSWIFWLVSGTPWVRKCVQMEYCHSYGEIFLDQKLNTFKKTMKDKNEWKQNSKQRKTYMRPTLSRLTRTNIFGTSVPLNKTFCFKKCLRFESSAARKSKNYMRVLFFPQEKVKKWIENYRSEKDNDSQFAKIKGHINKMGK